MRSGLAHRTSRRCPITEPTIAYLSTGDLEALHAAIGTAVANAETARVWIDEIDGGFKYSISRRTWSPAIGSTTEPGWGEPEPVATAPVPADCRCGHEYEMHYDWRNLYGNTSSSVPVAGCHGDCDCSGYVGTAGAEG